jgi:hypothetical protein
MRPTRDSSPKRFFPIPRPRSRWRMSCDPARGSCTSPTSGRAGSEDPRVRTASVRGRTATSSISSATSGSPRTRPSEVGHSAMEGRVLHREPRQDDRDRHALRDEHRARATTHRGCARRELQSWRPHIHRTPLVGEGHRRDPEPVTGDTALRIAALLGLPQRDGPEGLGTTIAIIAPGVEPDGDDSRVMPFIADALLWNFWPKMVSTTGGVDRPPFRGQSLTCRVGL